jgi:hypothetical protein
MESMWREFEMAAARAIARRLIQDASKLIAHVTVTVDACPTSIGSLLQDLGVFPVIPMDTVGCMDG